MLSALAPHHLYYLGHGDSPHIEICQDVDVLRVLPLARHDAGRHSDEALWTADIAAALPADPAAEWQFRINRGDGHMVQPEFAASFTTTLRSVWLQDGQLFDYRPAATVSPPQVLKLADFRSRLGVRPLYLYLPRGYHDHPERRYPVLYMHDGQNCFDAWVDDSYAGAWQADLAATLLIRQGLMQECVIAGVSNGREQRILEYLPPYARHLPPPRRPTVAVDFGDMPPPPLQRPLMPAPGRADQTLACYRDDIAPYLAQHYRVRTGRQHTATCGSSLGGLFSVYIAWEHSDFARHHAALSSSFWATRRPDGLLEAVERMRTTPRRDIRLWLDSGTFSSPGHGNDGQQETAAARQALLDAGYREGVEFQFLLAEGATHSESSWAARLPLIFQFLFPSTG